MINDNFGPVPISTFDVHFELSDAPFPVISPYAAIKHPWFTLVWQSICHYITETRILRGPLGPYILPLCVFQKYGRDYVCIRRNLCISTLHISVWIWQSRYREFLPLIEEMVWAILCFRLRPVVLNPSPVDPQHRRCYVSVCAKEPMIWISCSTTCSAVAPQDQH